MPQVRSKNALSEIKLIYSDTALPGQPRAITGTFWAGVP